MQPHHYTTQAVRRFTCLAADCPDTCCQAWGMQVMVPTIEKYRQEAPELLEAVTTGEAEYIMKRDPLSGQCVKLEGGLCSIHRDYGVGFLGDACRFYPRVTRGLGTVVHTTVALSCPETARLMLLEADGLALVESVAEDAPFLVKNFLPPELSEAQAIALHQVFLEVAGDMNGGTAHNLMRVYALAQALEMQPIKDWPEAAPLYLSFIESRIPTPEAAPTDLFHILQALHALHIASGKRYPKVAQAIQRRAEALGIVLADTGAMMLEEEAMTAALRVWNHMHEQSTALEPLLKRYLVAQMSLALFPFAGFGMSLSGRITIIGVRYATIRLMLSELPTSPDAREAVRLIQQISRVMDHLADPAFSMQAYTEAGWTRAARLRALVGDHG